MKPLKKVAADIGDVVIRGLDQPLTDSDVPSRALKIQAWLDKLPNGEAVLVENLAKELGVARRSVSEHNPYLRDYIIYPKLQRGFCRRRITTYANRQTTAAWKAKHNTPHV